MILWSHNDFLSRRMHYPVWIHCCKRPNYDFWISQGSVATILRWDGQNYSHLRQFASWCCTAKTIKIGHYFTELFKKMTLAQFCLRHGVQWLRFCQVLIATRLGMGSNAGQQRLLIRPSFSRVRMCSMLQTVRADDPIVCTFRRHRVAIWRH